MTLTFLAPESLTRQKLELKFWLKYVLGRSDNDFKHIWFCKNMVQKILKFKKLKAALLVPMERREWVCVWHLCHDGLFGNPIMPSQVNYFAHFLCEQSSPVPYGELHLN